VSSSSGFNKSCWTRERGFSFLFGGVGESSCSIAWMDWIGLDGTKCLFFCTYVRFICMYVGISGKGGDVIGCFLFGGNEWIGLNG
jgi:hypothetical protein